MLAALDRRAADPATQTALSARVAAFAPNRIVAERGPDGRRRRLVLVVEAHVDEETETEDGEGRGCRQPAGDTANVSSAVQAHLLGAGCVSRVVVRARMRAIVVAASLPASDANWAAPSSVWKAHPPGLPTPINAAGARRLMLPKSVANGSGGGFATKLRR